MKKKKTYQIYVNNDVYFVQQYITGGQLKRLTGCDNEYYRVIFQEPIPEEFKNIFFGDTTILDLENPNSPRFFETKFYQEKQ